MRAASFCLSLLLSTAAVAQPIRTGAAAFEDWRGDAPGVARLIRPDDLPAPYASRSASNAPSVVDQPGGARLQVPAGFTVTRLVGGLENPRQIRVAPNGDVFVAETGAGRVRILRAADGSVTPQRNVVFARGLDGPFGIAFYPPGPDPHWVYIAENNAVRRYPYRAGALAPTGPAEVVIPRLIASEGGHSTRDIAFSPDGARLYVSVGSQSNVATDLRGPPPPGLALGAGWNDETGRADVLSFDPQGHDARAFATGIRNCVSLAIQPGSGQPWCVTNERDGLGDNLPPDYVTHVQAGAFYGWPWYYIGDHHDPRLANARPDLSGHVTVPDVLLAPHSAPLGIAFYTGTAFPAQYRGDAFVALHGSWNRARRTGYKVVRVRLQDGKPTGVYEDFLTGFVIDNDNVWGRPVGVAVAHDGALLVTDDGGNCVWRIAAANP